MIIIPPALLLSASVSQPLTHARIGYENLLRLPTVGDVTVSSETSSGPKDAPLRPETYEYWLPSAMPATWQIDLGGPKEIDYVGIAGHTFGSSLVSVLVEYSTNGSSWTEFSDEAAPSDDSPMMFLDEVVFARYIKITLTALQSPPVIPRMSVVYVGEALAMSRPIYGGHSPIPLSRNTVLKQDLSAGGQFLGQNYRRHGVTGEAAFKNIKATWYRQNFDPFVKAARRFPYFFAWRPETFPAEVVYGWTTRNIKPSNMGTKDFMDVSFSISGIGHGD